MNFHKTLIPSLEEKLRTPTPEDVSEETLSLLSSQASTFHGREDLLPKLKARKRLVLKAGFDPTSSDIHLGHMLLLRLLRRLSELGHIPVFIVGDYTARIGDPSGKNKTRPPLSGAQIDENAKTYAEQAFLFLSRERSELVYNGLWLSKLSFEDVLRLSAMQTVARTLERDDFSKRFKEGSPIGLHEFLYPIMQGYDSVAIEADIEFGGTDQLFNLLVGRDLQRLSGQSPQATLTLPLLTGLDGVHKMSKSLGNYIAVKDTPEDVYGKSMSIPDSLILEYFRLILGKTDAELTAIASRLESENPKILKGELAFGITALLSSEAAARAAQEAFSLRFERRVDDWEAVEVQDLRLEVLPSGGVGLASAMVALSLAKSNTEAFRLIEQGAVSLDGQRVSERTCQLEKGRVYSLKVGKLGRARFQIAPSRD